MASGHCIAVVGAGTTVGREIVRILEERAFPVKDILAVESKGCAGGGVQFNGQDLSPRVLDEKAFKGAGIAFFAAGQKASTEFAKAAARAGSTVIDLSPAFRMDEDVPLVIPEINPGSAFGHAGIIACPSAPTIQLLLVLHPIHMHAGVKRAVVSSFQAVSDAGDAGMDELTSQIKNLFSFREAEVSAFPQQTAFNVVPQTGAFLAGGHTVDELGILAGTNRIMGNGRIRVCAVSAQVPVYYSHSQSVVIETEKRIAPEEVRGLLKKALSVLVEDEPSEGIYPLAVNATGKDECLVGRIRQDLSSDNGIVLWSAMDNIRKGAAPNAVQIAELLVTA